MDSNIEDLLQLQELDRRLDRTREDLSRIPRELEIHDREIQKHRETFAECEKSLEQVRSEQKKCAGDKEDARRRLAEYKTQLLGLKTNQEYKVMLRQIAGLEQHIDDLDSRTIELMYREDETVEEIDGARKVLERSVQRAEKRKELLNAEKRELEEKTAALASERDQRAESVNVRFLRKYEQLRSAGKGLAVVGLIRGACGGCMTNVPPQSAVEIAQGNTFTCPICGRFVVWTEDSSFSGD
jgi:predicted  nucleic acid-binding Zn-ribbon protein